MDGLSKLAASILANADAALTMAEKIAPLIPGRLDDDIIMLGRTAVDVIEAYQESVDTPVAELEAKRAELEQRVLSGLRSEADKLRG